MIIKFYLHLPFLKKWSVGRVARQWSAKPSTAVQIRYRPLTKSFFFSEEAFFVPFNIRLLEELGNWELLAKQATCKKIVKSK